MTARGDFGASIGRGAPTGQGALALAWIAVCAGGCSGAPPRDDPATRVPAGLLDPAQIAAQTGAETNGDPREPAPTGPGVAVVWRTSIEGRGFVYPRLIGVTPDGRRAWVAISNVSQHPRTPDLFWNVIEIDTARGQVASRWETTIGAARADARMRFGQLWPLVDEPADLARLAGIVAATQRPGPRGFPHLTVSPDGRSLLHHRWGDDAAQGDWIILRDADGGNPRRLARSLTAAYRPEFSPDGVRVAYTGCTSPRPRTPCTYGVYVETPGGQVQRAEGLDYAVHLEWGRHGRYLYTVGNGRERPACVRRTDTDSMEVETLICADGLRDVRVALDDAGVRGVIYGYRGEPGTQTYVYTWFRVTDGEVLYRGEVPRGVGLMGLRGDGVILLTTQSGSHLVDPARKRERALSGRYSGADASQWLPDGRILLGRTRVFPAIGAASGDREFALVWMDVDALLAGAPEPP